MAGGLDNKQLLPYSVLRYKTVILLLLGVVLAASLTACRQSETTSLPEAVQRATTVGLPTAVPTLPSTPLNTRVMPVEVLTPQPTATITPIPDEGRAMVVGIVDGHTVVVVMEGDSPDQVYAVQYLGIEAPPPDDPWGAVARETNRKLTNFKVVRLVRDETNFDDRGVLHRYVYLDEQLLSILMAERGLARAVVSPPNTRLADNIVAAEARARADNLGLWSGSPPTSTPTPVAATAEGTEEFEGTPLTTPPVISETLILTVTPIITPAGTVTATLRATDENGVTSTVVVSPTGTSSSEASE